MVEFNYITGDSTAAYIGIAVFFVLLGIAFFALVMANYKHRAESQTWYKDQVYAFKVGYIQKKAKELDIEMIYPPKADLAQRLEEEVSDDISTP